MNPHQKHQEKRSKTRLKELSKLCHKTEALSLPLQGALLNAINSAEIHEVLECVEQLEAKLGMVNAALHQLHERSLVRGGGASHRFAKDHVEQMRAHAMKPAAGHSNAGPSNPTVTLQGVCPEFPLLPVFQFIAGHHKTGHLEIKLTEETITIGILSGRIIQTSTDQPRRGERLGEIMIENGEVQPDLFIAFIDAFRPELGRPLGMALVDNNIVSSNALTEALTDQMQFHFDRVFEAESCSFVFYEDEVNASTGLSIGMSEFLIETGRATGHRDSSLQPPTT